MVNYDYRLNRICIEEKRNKETKTAGICEKRIRLILE